MVVYAHTMVSTGGRVTPKENKQQKKVQAAFDFHVRLKYFEVWIGKAIFFLKKRRNSYIIS